MQVGLKMYRMYRYLLSAVLVYLLSKYIERIRKFLLVVKKKIKFLGGLDLRSSWYRHFGSLFICGQQEKLDSRRIDVFDSFDTHCGLVHDVTDTLLRLVDEL